MQQHSQPIPSQLVGSFRRFGAYGPAYEVIGAESTSQDETKIFLNVRVVDSGESMRYPYQDALKDPEA